MRFGRYKKFNWEAARIRRERRMLDLAKLPVRPPSVLLEINARLLLEAYAKGPWRAIWKLIKCECADLWGFYGWRKWEWLRVHILRLRPDPEIAEFQREMAETEALEELVKQL